MYKRMDNEARWFDISSRTERLKETRMCFQNEHRSQVNRQLQTDQRKDYMPYWAGYLLRTVVVAFLLVCFFLYGMQNEKKQQALKDQFRSSMKVNPFIETAYDCYSTVNYEKMFANLKSNLSAFVFAEDK